MGIVGVLLSGTEWYQNILTEVIRVVLQEGEERVRVLFYTLQFRDSGYNALGGSRSGESCAMALELQYSEHHVE